VRGVRQVNPLIFDLVLFLVFTFAAFGVYVLTEAAGAIGAVIGLLILGLICVVMVISR
jgi:hypothetical protein